MLEQTYRTMNEKMEVPPALAAKTLEKMENRRNAAGSKAVPAGRRFSHRRAATVLMACVLVLALSVTALAAAFPGFRETLFGEHSKVAPFLTPVAASGEDDGIRMEVLGAMSDDGTIVAYFTLTDEEGKNRLSPEMELQTSAKLNGEYPEEEWMTGNGLSRYTEVLDYDPETQTAFCRFDMTTSKDQWEALEAQAQEADTGFGIDSLLRFFDSGGYNARGVSMRLWNYFISTSDIEYDILTLDENDLTRETLPVIDAWCDTLETDPETGDFTPAGQVEKLSLEEADALAAEQGYPSVSAMFPRNEQGDLCVLKPTMQKQMGYGTITSAGYLGGMLHIQLESTMPPEETSTWEGVGNLFAVKKDEAQELIDALATKGESGWRFTNSDLYQKLDSRRMDSVDFVIDEDGVHASYPTGWEKNHMEYVFSIAPEELKDYAFVVYSIRADRLFLDVKSGDFTLEDTLPAGTVSMKNVQAGDIALETLEVTPLGAFISGTRSDLTEVRSFELVFGDTAVSCPMSAYNQNYYWGVGNGDYTSLKFVVEDTVAQLENLTAVRINGVDIPVE